MKQAMLSESITNNRVRCNLCAHRCVIKEGKFGVCNVRQNIDGELFTLVYGRAISENVDPIEKKPLYHFLPGSKSYSIATPGCNFRCQWCQNWEIAHMPRERGLILGNDSSPTSVVNNAKAKYCLSIAYTYTEPTVFFEFTYETAKLASESNIANVYVTNGYMTPEMIEVLHPYLDAANVDLKSFRKRTYQRYIGGGLMAVLDSLKEMKKSGIWVEVTTLVVPGINDDPGELRDIAKFIAEDLGLETPWHISRFFPGYKMANLPPTPVGKLHLAREIGLEEGLRYVYIGNVGEESNTVCHECNKILIRRSRYWILENNIRDGSCASCGQPAAGVWL
jgi:pyruvate formate lyase activating enzyme